MENRYTAREFALRLSARNCAATLTTDNPGRVFAEWVFHGKHYAVEVNPQGEIIGFWCTDNKVHEIGTVVLP